MRSIEYILFDFDGVLAESLDIKTQAFYDMYLPFGKDVAEWVRSFHLENGGVSRFEKFRLYHKKFLNKDLSEMEMNALVDEFSAKVLHGVIASDEVKGAEAFLKNEGSAYHKFIITGTPTDEIVKILRGKSWDSFFEGVYGSPQNKKHWVSYLIDSKKVNPVTAVFVGDALADYEAAISGKIPFILREHAENKPLFAEIDCLRIQDMTELQQVLTQL